MVGTALAASYSTYPNSEIGALGEDWPRDDSFVSTLLYSHENFFSNDEPGADAREYDYVLWHEWGHLHNLPTLGFQEQESNVHMLAMIVYNQVMGADIDTAPGYSGFQR